MRAPLRYEGPIERGKLRHGFPWALIGLFVASCTVPKFAFVDNAGLAASHCSNLISDEGETGVDCGGTCPGCPAGGTCLVNNDCASPSCIANVCQDASCTDGVKSGSETDIDCGGGACAPCATSLACVSARDCVTGVCQSGACAQALCTDGVQNGNESDVDCGGGCPTCLPGQKCRLPSDCSGSDCTNNVCSLSCSDGKGDCDANPSNGSETNLKIDVAHCGACDDSCNLAHANAVCTGGKCQIGACIAPFADCDGDPKNGCETNTSADANNCSGCGKTCAAINGTPSCVAAQCQVTCAAGYSDCDDNRANGCEKKTDSDSNNCGSCGQVCEAGNGTAWCNKGKCGVSSCPAGFGDCNADPADGCEVNLTQDPDNCKSCGSACVVANGTAACSGSVCKIATCDGAGHSDCSGGYADGCETPTASDPANCGGCGLECQTLNASGSSCIGSQCSPACMDGWAACSDPSAGCSTRIDTPSNCGSCGTACYGGTPFCLSRACASRLDIVVVNSTTVGSTSASGTSLTLQHSLETAVGSYRLVVVGVTGFGNGSASQPASVQYAGVAMVPAQLTPSGNQVFAGVYYLADADLPAAPGSYLVSVGASDSNNTFGLTANVLELRNVEQATGSIDNGAGTGNTESCALHKASDAVTVSALGDYIYSIAAAFGSVDVNPNTTGQTITEQYHAPSFDTVAGYMATVGTGQRTATWALASCNASAHAMVSLKATVTP